MCSVFLFLNFFPVDLAIQISGLRIMLDLDLTIELSGYDYQLLTFGFSIFNGWRKFEKKKKNPMPLTMGN